MSERYLNAPVEFGCIHPDHYWARLVCGCASEAQEGTSLYDSHIYGYGPTKGAAFADLQQKLGYEEVK